MERAVAAIRNNRRRGGRPGGRSGVFGVTHIGVTNVAISEYYGWQERTDYISALKLLNTFTDYYDIWLADFSSKPASTYIYIYQS
jgi:hypothetical protein